MSEIRFDTISHSWLAWDTENDQPLNPQPIIEAFTPHDIYYDARVPFGAIYEATQSDTIHITADFAESLTLTLAAPDVFVAFERNVRAVSVTTEVENGDDVLLVNLQNGALFRLVQSGADAVRFGVASGGRAIDGGDHVIGFQLQDDRVVFVHTPSATDTNTDNAPQTLPDFLMSAAGFDGITGTADDWFVASPIIDHANGENVVTGVRFKFADTSPSVLESKLAASIISIGFDAPLALADFMSMIGGAQNFDTATLIDDYVAGGNLILV